MLTHRLRDGTHTASTRSPAASIYAEITLGVIILLVGSLILSRLTSRGSRVSVRMRRRLMSSVNRQNGQSVATAKCRPGRTGERFWSWYQSLDGYQGTVLLHGYSQSESLFLVPQSLHAATRDRGHAVGRVRVVSRPVTVITYKLITIMPVSCGLVCVARAYIISGVSFCFERGARCPAGRKSWGLPHQNQDTRSCPPRRCEVFSHLTSILLTIINHHRSPYPSE